MTNWVVAGVAACWLAYCEPAKADGPSMPEACVVRTSNTVLVVTPGGTEMALSIVSDGVTRTMLLVPGDELKFLSCDLSLPIGKTCHPDALTLEYVVLP